MENTNSTTYVCEVLYKEEIYDFPLRAKFALNSIEKDCYLVVNKEKDEYYLALVLEVNPE
jgi:hypothetical protein